MPHNELVEQRVMEEFFRKHLDLFPGARELVDIKIYRHEPRLVFDPSVILVKYEVTLKSADGTTALEVLRGSSDTGNKRLKAYHILKKLWASGFDQGRYLVPQPLGYFPEFHLLLYKSFSGRSLMHEFELDNAGYLNKISESINWLAKFHQDKPSAIPEINTEASTDEKRQFEGLLQKVMEKYHSQSERIKGVGELMIRQEKILLKDRDFSIIHGDYQPNNIILDEDKIGVIDFNDAIFYDELFDLAYFTTQVKFMLARLRAVDCAAFLEQETERYFRLRKLEYDDRAKKRLALFVARTLLNIKALLTHDAGVEILKEIETNAQKSI